jgi:5-methyltetrahydrofolate--homocysteine methyltransferase
VRTSLGLSNISFGLPNRHFLNAIYLNMAVTSGLDMAIMNPLDERMMDTIKGVRLFLNRDRDAREYMAVVGPKKLVHTEDEVLAKQAKAAGEAGGAPTPAGSASATTSGAPAVIKTKGAEPPADPYGRKLYDCILEGDRDGILPLVEQGLSEGRQAMDILNQFLIKAIEEVGRLFGEGIYFLPQLMLSAASMKKAFARLKPEIQKAKEGVAEIGTVVLATVQGDIHDIGKNIVGVLLENYGFKVVDLGRDVKNEVVLAEARNAGADMVGLSALMTTTMPQMKRVIEMFEREGFDCPVLVGGAATTRSFATTIGAHGYGKDAQEAVKIALKLLEERKVAKV